MRAIKLSWTVQALLVIAALLVGFILIYSFERPPIRTEQLGFRGTGMEQLQNPRTMRLVMAQNAVPEAQPPADGPIDDQDKASAVYENVQVLGELSNAQFLRLMQAMTEWVVPAHIRDEGNGCNYCHIPENLASDDVYTKVVTRRMLQMTATINADWKPHVAETGVTCYTCHRGQPVPAHVWSTFSDNRAGLVGPTGQNRVAPAANLSSLPYDPFTPFLLNDNDIRNISTTWKPGSNPDDVRISEWTYSLMVHMSQALAVNCTFCHNSRAFGSWEQSPPQRLNAWHGIRMARAVNNTYMQPLTPIFAAHPFGPEQFPSTIRRVGQLHGDALKVNCATCHQGVNRPLLGAPMLQDYPELNMVNRAPPRAAALAPPAQAARN